MSVTSTNYEVLGRGSKSYQVCGRLVFGGDGAMVRDIVLLYSPRVVVIGERYYACLIL